MAPERPHEPTVSALLNDLLRRVRTLERRREIPVFAFEDGLELGAMGAIDFRQGLIAHRTDTGLIEVMSDIAAITEGGLNAHQLPYWFQDNVAASQSAVVLNMDGNTSRSEVPMVRQGYITGIVVITNVPRTAGTVTVEVTKNGTGVGLLAVLDGSYPSAKATTQPIGVDSFVSGDRIGAKITSDSGWLPTTADITVVIEVQLTGPATAVATILVGTSQAGHFESQSPTYATAREGGGSVSATTLGTLHQIGQWLSGGTYFVWQFFVSFDTSAIPSDATILSAEFALVGAADVSATDFIAEARLHDWGVTPEAADFVPGSQLASKGLLATFNSANYQNEVYNTFTENGSSLRNGIVKGGFTRFIISSDRQRLGTTPTGGELLDMHSDGAGKEARLVVVYE